MPGVIPGRYHWKERTIRRTDHLYKELLMAYTQVAHRSTFAARKLPMSIPVKNNVRTALLACFVLLGMQLWFPLAIHAAEVPVTLEEATMPPSEPEDEASELDQALALIAFHAGAFHAYEAASAILRTADRKDRSGLSVLRAAGRQPSAP
jgi:hypothetical protein